MFKWLLINPWFAASLAYSIGIAVGIKIYFDFPQILLTMIFFLIFLASIGFLTIKHYRALLILFVTAIAAGILNSTVQAFNIQRSPLQETVNQNKVQVYGTIVTRPRQNDFSLCFLMSVKQVNGLPKSWGNLWVRIRSSNSEQNDQLSTLDIGKNVFFNGEIKAASLPNNFFGFNSQKYLLSKDCGYEAYIYNPKLIIDVNTDNGFGSFINRLSGQIVKVIEKNFDPLHSQLMISLIYGDRTVSVSDELVRAFRFAGLTHLLVVSGAQVGLLALIIFTLLRPLGYPGITGWRGIVIAIIMISLLILFGLITGFDLSIKRSILMAALWLFARLVNRRITPITALAQSALIITIPNPLAILSASYQLSFLATFAVLYGLNVINRYEVNYKHVITPQTIVMKILFYSVVSSTSVSILLSPILATTYGQVPIYSTVSNIIAVPLSGVILIWGVITNASFLLLGSAISLPFKMVMEFLLDLLMLITQGVSQLPYASGNLEPPGLSSTLLYYLGILTIIELFVEKPKLKATHRNLLILLGLSSLVIAISVYYINFGKTKLIVPYLSSGDAVVIRHHQKLYGIINCTKGKKFNNSIKTLASSAQYLGFNKFSQIIAIEPSGFSNSEKLKDLSREYIKLINKSTNCTDYLKPSPDIDFSLISENQWESKLKTPNSVIINYKYPGEYYISDKKQCFQINVRKKHPDNHTISLLYEGAVLFEINSGGEITKKNNSMQKKEWLQL